MTNGDCTVGVRHTSEISGLQKDVVEIKGEYKEMCQKINSINNNVNRLLGGVAIACVLLAVNIIIQAI